MNNILNNNIKKQAIGIFDSGIGGLTVTKDLVNILPAENLIYVGDNVHFPYGEKTNKQLHAYCFDICSWLIKQNVKLILIACNTASAAYANIAKKYFDIPVIGIINAGAMSAINATKNKTIGLLATNSTIKSGAYENALLNIDCDIKVCNIPAPNLVSNIENNLEEVLINPSKQFLKIIEDYSQQFLRNNCDTVILGCTHYSPLKRLFQQVCGDKINFVSPSYNAVKEVEEILMSNNMLNDNIQNNLFVDQYKFYCTNKESKENFDKFASILLSENVNVNHLVLNN